MGLIEYWRLHGVPYRRGVSNEVLNDFESQYNASIPAAMRSSYLLSDGTWVDGANGCDENGFSFWPLSSVRRYPSHPWAFIFADYREESWWYAIDFAGDGQGRAGSVYLVGDVGDKPLAIAEDFAEFVTLYVRDDPRLYLTEARRFNAEKCADRPRP